MDIWWCHSTQCCCTRTPTTIYIYTFGYIKNICIHERRISWRRARTEEKRSGHKDTATENGNERKSTRRQHYISAIVYPYLWQHVYTEYNMCAAAGLFLFALVCCRRQPQWLYSIHNVHLVSSLFPTLINIKLESLEKWSSLDVNKRSRYKV